MRQSDKVVVVKYGQRIKWHKVALLRRIPKGVTWRLFGFMMLAPRRASPLMADNLGIDIHIAIDYRDML